MAYDIKKEFELSASPVRPLLIEQKQYLTREDAERIRELQRVCEAAEPVALKLELDFKLADAAVGARAPAARIGAKYQYSEYEMRLKGDFSPADVPALAFQKSQAPEDLEEEAKGMTTWFAERDGQTVGIVRLQLTDGIGGIYGLEVEEEQRGKGYGRAILQHSILQLKAAAADVVLLQVETGNETALGLYHAFGFRETATMDYFSIAVEALRK